MVRWYTKPTAVSCCVVMEWKGRISCAFVHISCNRKFFVVSSSFSVLVFLKSGVVCSRYEQCVIMRIIFLLIRFMHFTCVV